MPRTCIECQTVYGDEHGTIRFCANCGHMLPASAPAPVAPLPAPPPAPLTPGQPKSPGLAALLSFLLVGMGQVYLGQVEKGLMMLGVVLVLMLTVVLGPLGLLILLLNVLDAFLLAGRINKGRKVQKWEFFFSRGGAGGGR